MIALIDCFNTIVFIIYFPVFIPTNQYFYDKATAKSDKYKSGHFLAWSSSTILHHIVFIAIFHTNMMISDYFFNEVIIFYFQFTISPELGTYLYWAYLREQQVTLTTSKRIGQVTNKPSLYICHVYKLS